MVTMTPDRLRQLRRVGLYAGFRADCFRRRLVRVVSVRPRQGRGHPHHQQDVRRRCRDRLGRARVRPGGDVPRYPRPHPPDHGKADPLHDRFGEVLAFAVRAVLVVVLLQPDGGRAGRHDRARPVRRTRQEGRLQDRPRRARHRRVRDPRPEGDDQPSAHRQGDAGGEARLRDRPLRGRQRSADAQLRGARGRRRQDAAQGSVDPDAGAGDHAAAYPHRRSGGPRRHREGDGQAAGGRVQVAGRRGGAGGRDCSP